MNGWNFFFSLAFNNLRRSGQRTLVAILCVAFGVMSLVAMTLVSQSIERTLILTPGEQLGADISLGRTSEDTISPSAITGLQGLQESGQIQKYTLIAYTSTLTYHLPGSGTLHFVGSGMGIDPASYPLAGSLSIGQPQAASLGTLLQKIGDVVITQDIAQEAGLKVGDTIFLADLHYGTPLESIVRGIASDTPNHQGSKIYYSQDTAAKISAGTAPLNTAMVNSTSAEAVATTLESTGWYATLAPQSAAAQSEAQDFITLSLKGAGLLGLMVSGIGIANTMQVLLRRRQREVAIWKVLGYRQVELQAMFTLEAALLGIAGSLLGAGLGLLVSTQLVEIFRRTSNLLFTWSASPLTILSGVAAGVMTTLVFAVGAIVAASQARPMALLRNEPVDVAQLSKVKAGCLAVALALPFAAVTSLVMGSILSGVAVLLAGLAGLAILGGIFSLLLRLGTRLLPSAGLPLVRMAKNKLKRSGLALVFAMIAIFGGVVTMTFGAVIVQSGSQEMDERSIQIAGDNLMVIAPSSQQPAVRQVLDAQKDLSVIYGYEIPLKAIQISGDNGRNDVEPILIGRSDPHDFQVSGAAWGSSPDGVYVDRSMGIPTGSPVEITLKDGSTRHLTVAGQYAPTGWSLTSAFTSRSGLLMPASFIDTTIVPDSMTYFLQAPQGEVNAMTDTLGTALPGSTVINLVAYSARYLQVYQNLFVLALAMAGLALLAGILLIVNSVSLAMLDRRYEVGILKAVGYTRANILMTLEVEYGLVAALASLAGLVVVQIFLWVIALGNELAASLLTLTPQVIVFILLFGVGLVLLAVLGVCWKPTMVSPTVVLSERE